MKFLTTIVLAVIASSTAFAEPVHYGEMPPVPARAIRHGSSLGGNHNVMDFHPSADRIHHHVYGKRSVGQHGHSLHFFQHHQQQKREPEPRGAGGIHAHRQRSLEESELVERGFADDEEAINLERRSHASAVSRKTGLAPAGRGGLHFNKTPTGHVGGRSGLPPPNGKVSRPNNRPTGLGIRHQGLRSSKVSKRSHASAGKSAIPPMGKVSKPANRPTGKKDIHASLHRNIAAAAGTKKPSARPNGRSGIPPVGKIGKPSGRPTGDADTHGGRHRKNGLSKITKPSTARHIGHAVGGFAKEVASAN